MRRAVFIVGIWAGLFGLYLLFAGSASRAEVLAGFVVSGIAVAGHMRTRAVANRQLHVQAPWLRLAGRIVVALVRDTALVASGLMRSRAGSKAGRRDDDAGVQFRRVHACGRGPAGDRNPRSVGRTERLCDRGAGAPQGMLMHAFVPRQSAKDVQWPV